MRSRLARLVAAVALVALATPSPAVAKEANEAKANEAKTAAAADVEAEVRAAFAAYAEAVAAGDGKRALALTDRATVRYNDALVEHARSADRAALAKLPLIDRLAILRLRHELTAAELAAMKGADLVRHGVEHGWSKAWKLDADSIERVAVSGASATVATAGGQLGKTLEWTLLREDHRWRISVVSVLPTAEALLQKSAKRFNKSDDELVELALRMLTGKAVSPALWDGPR